MRVLYHLCMKRDFRAFWLWLELILVVLACNRLFQVFCLACQIVFFYFSLFSYHFLSFKWFKEKLRFLCVFSVKVVNFIEVLVIISVCVEIWSKETRKVYVFFVKNHVLAFWQLYAKVLNLSVCLRVTLSK